MSQNSSFRDMERDMEDLKNLSYSTEFSKDINTQMQVPDMIRMTGDEGGDVELQWQQQSVAVDMQVPGRLLVGGEVPVALTTPPRVITLGEHYFPTVSDETHDNHFDKAEPNTQETKPKRSLNLEPNGPIKMGVAASPAVEDEHYLSMGADKDDVIEEPVGKDLSKIRTQVAKLSQRVVILESENAQRAQREYIMYSAMLAYTVYKAIKFVYKHW